MCGSDGPTARANTTATVEFGVYPRGPSASDANMFDPTDRKDDMSASDYRVQKIDLESYDRPRSSSRGSSVRVVVRR